MVTSYKILKPESLTRGMLGLMGPQRLCGPAPSLQSEVCVFKSIMSGGLTQLHEFLE